MTETARRKRRKGPSATRRRQGMTPAKIQGQRKVILAQNGISARYAAVVKSRIAPWCFRVSSILRRSLQGARPIHERPETALCAARAPPRRRVGSRVRETRLCKSCAFAPNGVGARRECRRLVASRARGGSAPFSRWRIQTTVTPSAPLQSP